MSASSDGLAGERRLAELGEVARLDRRAEPHQALERGELAGDRAKQGRLAGAIGSDDADPLAALRLETGHPGDGDRSVGAGRRGEPDHRVADPDHQVARPSGALTAQSAARQGQGRTAPGCLHGRLAQGLQPPLVLVHLGELAMAAIALDQLLLTSHRASVDVGILVGSRIRRLALREVGREGPTEDAQVAVAQLPDPLDDRVEEGPVVGRDDDRAVAAAQGLLEPLDGRYIEVVGGLVEQQAGPDRR